MIKPRILLGIVFTFAAATAGGAAYKEMTVKFKTGTTSASYKGETQGEDLVSYFLDARAGQNLAIKFKANMDSCEFVVQRPDGVGTVFDSYAKPGEYTARLGNTGRHEVKVYQTRATAHSGLICRYAIGFEITD